ncbi:MAG: NAD(+)/NADH kinase [Candidatus Riflebacteria bacterium]|nr:NAD(+)/NADH kinase [Candidatus Riflebacteria bacterium]
MPSKSDGLPLIERVLVLYRKSTYQAMALEKKDQRFLELIQTKDPSVSRMERAHQQHYRCLHIVQEALAKYQLEVTAAELSLIGSAGGHDLVVTVGGDGTFLSASHYLQDTPVLGVVSSDASVGHFCGATAARFPRMLKAVLEGEVKSASLQRLKVFLSDAPLRELALNEVLLCHRNPASTSRYLIRVNDVQEEQVSSGAWIATASGSTAAIGSAGGKLMPPLSRRIQFKIREPYRKHRDRYVLKSGFACPDQKLTFISKMEEGKIFVDGPHISYPFGLGERLSIGLSEHPLRVFGMAI